ncbi:hypothetical protein MASSI9I_90102 [Massilia sp. 9I]|nr:hypothetical protein MASSI9I_90102 [Massilia sp. 9I]
MAPSAPRVATVGIRHILLSRYCFHAPIKKPLVCKGNVLWYGKQPKCDPGNPICKNWYVHICTT